MSDTPEALVRPDPDAIKRPVRPPLLDFIGPGLSTGASDDDPSGIATCSQTGAQLGFDLGWTLLFSWPRMCAIREISARIGRVTRRGMAGTCQTGAQARPSLQTPL